MKEEKIQEEKTEKEKEFANFIKEEKISKKVIDAEGNKCVVVRYKGIDKRKTQEGDEYQKMVFVCQFPAGNEYDLELKEKAARELTENAIKEGLHVTQGDDLVGCMLLLTPKENGQFNWVEVGLISIPKK